MAAKHITIYSILRRSNIDNKPIHLTYHNFLKLVAQRQKVKPVIDAMTKGGDALRKILNCDGVNQ